jgi:hypothetical protein
MKCPECNGKGFTIERHDAPYGYEQFDCEACAPKERDFVTSDFCGDCGGIGYFNLPSHPESKNEPEQCPECERLHDLEVRADRRMDEMKGN